MKKKRMRDVMSDLHIRSFVVGVMIAVFAIFLSALLFILFRGVVS